MKQPIPARFHCNFISKVLCLIFLYNSHSVFGQCDLVPLGPSGENQASYGYFSNLSSVHYQNKTFICYRDKKSQIFIRQWDGVAWTTVGGGPVSSSTVAMDPHIAVDNAGKIYVVYRQVDNAAHIAVRVWDGNTWTALGTNWLADEYWGAPTSMVNRLAIAIDPANNVYIASYDQPSGERLSVMKWNGAGWVFVGSRGFSAGVVTDIHFAFDASGSPYVGFVQGSQGASAEVMKFDSENWVSVGTRSLSAFEEYATYLTNDRDGNIYFAHETTGFGFGMLVEKLVNEAWVAVGGKIQTGFSYLTSLSSDDAGGLYLSYSDHSVSPKKAAVKQWRNGEWANMEFGLSVESRAAVNPLSIMADGKMRFVYAELNGEAIMLESDGARWNELVSRGISDGIAANPSVAIDKQGVVYIFYQDIKNGFRGVVRKWNGSAWTDVGNPILANNPVYDPRIVMDENGTPYVVFTDFLHGFKLCIMKLVDNQWQTVGDPYFSDGQAGWPSLAFNEGVPYVAYVDKSLGWKAMVKKWTGSIWESVGPEGISDLDAGDTQILFDQEGNPLLVYLGGKGVEAGKVIVKKWLGSDWTTLGSGTISEVNASSPTIARGPSGSVYLAYRNAVLGQELVVQKWDGNRWHILENSNISTGIASSIALKADPSGAPVVSFIDSGLGNQFMVKRWNGNSWNIVSQWQVSSNHFSSLSAVFDSTGTPFVAYCHGDVYAKMGKSAVMDGPGTQTINIDESASGAFREDCELIALVKSSGPVPVSGTVTAKVWVEEAQHQNYVSRHYEITPADNASVATGRVTLFFTQEDFDAHNSVNAVRLPANPSDLRGIANVLIEKRSGTSSTQTGLPNSYSGTPVNINPRDSDISWNVAAQRWEVTFDVVGFSGFFLKTSEAPLPVRLVKFQGSRMEGNALLSWETASEFGSSHFEIEKSFDANTFRQIGSLASKEFSNTANSYSFLDKEGDFPDNTYYRLRMVDLDGSYTYSRTICIGTSGRRDNIIVFPNPVAGGSQITIQGNTTFRQIILFDKAGQAVRKSTTGQISETPRLSTDNLPSGNYLLKIETENGGVTRPILIP